MTWAGESDIQVGGPISFLKTSTFPQKGNSERNASVCDGPIFAREPAHRFQATVAKVAACGWDAGDSKPRCHKSNSGFTFL